MALLYWIFLLIDSVVYNFINYAYQIFLLLSRVVLAEEETISPFIQRVYTIIGIVMLFIITYSFLTAIVNPESNVKSMGQTVFGIVKAIVLLALVPPMFDFAYIIQDSILDQNTIGRIILGGGGSEKNPADVINNGGIELSSTMIKAFIFPKGGKEPSEVVLEGDTMYTLNEIWDAIGNNGTFRYLTMLSEELGLDNGSEIDYQIIISTGAACYILYLLISYCLSLGLRIIKLLFYEIIAPIPILASILPKKKDMFNKWLSITITTFLEVFIRVGIMYLTVYIASLVPNIELIQKQNNVVGFLANACILMGLFTFVKKAPELIAEVTGIDSSKMSTGIRDQLKSGGFFTAAGIAGGAAMSGARRLAGTARNVKKQWKDNSKGFMAADGKGRRKMAKNVFKKAGGALVGGVLGTAMSTIRGGIGGFNKDASSIKDIRETTQKAYKAESERVATAQAYNAKHGGFIGGIGGHITDSVLRTANNLGIRSIDALVDENKVLSEIKQAKSKVKSSALELIDKEADSASPEFTLGMTAALSYTDKDGTTVSMDPCELSAANLRHFKLKLDEARASGKGVEKAQNEYDTFRTAFGKATQDYALLNNEHYEALDEALRAKLASVRTDGVQFRQIITDNIGNDVVRDAGYTLEAVKGDFSVTSAGPTKSIGDKIDIRMAENQAKIVKFNQQTSESSDK